MVFRSGPDKVTQRSLFDIGLFGRFIGESMAMKILVGLMLVLIFASQALANVLPVLKPFVNAGSLAIILFTVGLIYQQYLIALAVGFTEYKFLKVIGMWFLAGMAMIFLPAQYKIPFITDAALTVLGFAIFFTGKASFIDIIKVIIVGIIAGFVFTLVTAGAAAITLANNLELLSVMTL